MKINVKINSTRFMTASGIEERFGLIINGKLEGEYTKSELLERLEKLKKRCDKNGIKLK